MATRENKAIVALGTSVYNNRIVQKKTSVFHLFKKLSIPTIQDKKDGKYFIYASFKKDLRNAQNVEKYYGATIDLDNTSLTLKQIEATFSRYIYCIYTTHSHKAKGKGNRYRLVLPYKNPVEPITHVETMLYLMDLLGAKDVDLSSKALSRPMYLPAVHPTRKRTFQFIKNVKGFFFNPMSEHIREEIAQLNFENYNKTDDPINDTFDINKDVEEGDRNNSLARAVGKMIKTGVATSELLGLAESWNQTKLSPPLKLSEVKTITKSIIDAHKRNHGDLNWGFDEIIQRIKQSSNIVEDYDHILDMLVMAKSKEKLKQSQIEMIINRLNTTAKIGKRTIQQEVTTKELELAGKLEDGATDSFESTMRALKEDFKEWVYVGTDDRIYNLRTGEYFKREAFAAIYATPAIEGSLFGIIMKYNLVRKVSRLEFDPANDEIYIRDNVRYANTYIPPEIFPLPGNVEKVINHFKYLIPDDFERGIILDFIAHLVQKPGEKIRWMPIIKGGKGVGKTIIAETIIMPIVGFTNFSKVSNAVIKSDFNAWQLDKQLVVFEELDVGTNYKEKEQLTDSLKSFITDNILTAHRKGLDPYDTINKCNALGFTNKEDPIIITPDERRFCMIRTSVKPKNILYYKRLAKFVAKNKEELYYYFMERDISNFSPLKAPDTSYTTEIKQQSLGWPGSIIHEWLENKEHPIYKAGCASFLQIADYINVGSTGRYKTMSEDLKSAGSTISKNLHNVLRQMNFTRYINTERTDGRIFVGDKWTYIWILPDQGPEVERLSPTLITRRVNKIKIVDDNWSEE